MLCEDRFRQTYGREPDGRSFCPYRICPIGAHSDHNLGKITGLAIDKGIHIAYSAKHNGVVELQSVNFPKRAQSPFQTTARRSPTQNSCAARSSIPSCSTRRL